MALSGKWTPEELKKLLAAGAAMRLKPSDIYSHLTDAQAYSVTGGPPPPPAKAWNNYDKLRMRLGLAEGEQFGVHMNIFQGPNKVFVFIVDDDRAVILDDDASLFPSDKLIGLYRLFKQQ